MPSTEAKDEQSIERNIVPKTVNSSESQMSQLPSSPPYFNRLLDKLAAANPNTQAAFGRHVHWGYWRNPSEAKLTFEDYGHAAEELCLQVLDRAGIHDGMRVLDIGCGFGGTLACMNERHSNLELIGVNIDELQLQRAASLVEPRSGNTIQLLLADAARLPVAEGSVDEILAVESIFHFDRPQFLSEVSRLLCRGGSLTLSDFIPQERAVPYIEAMNLQNHESVLSTYGAIDIGWSLERYRSEMEKYGLVLVDVCNVTSQTLPTYEFLSKNVSKWSEGADAEHFLQATSLLEKASRRGFIRYTIIRLERS